MSKDGYAFAASFKDIDFNGILNVIINNKRFDTKFADDLSKPQNIICQAREVGKLFRHSPGLEISKTEYLASICILEDVLSNIKCHTHQKKASEANKMILQLKNESLNVSSSDATKVIEGFIAEETRKLSAFVNETKQQALDDIAYKGDGINKEIKEAQLAFLRDVRQAAETVNQISAVNLEQIVSSKKSAIDEIEKIGKREKTAVVKAGKDLKRKALKLKEETKRMRTSIQKEKELAVADVRSSACTSGGWRVSTQRISETVVYPKLKNDLRNDLIHLCRKRHIHLPVSPLREENEVQLLRFYVAPTLKCKEYEKGPYTNQKVDKTRPISSYHEVFFKGSKEFQDIYLASPAGTGKTSYVKRMSLAWCCSHSPEEEQNNYFTDEEMETMKAFEFFFLLSMRETSQYECNLDDMIKEQVIRQLSLSHTYSDDFLQEVLHNEKCLIIIDGLDEWTHQTERCSQSASKVPHRKVRKKCTILTTARPWKVETVIEGNYFIDQHIEMSDLEEPSANKLIDNALSHLNEKFNDQKTSDEFITLLKQNRVHKLKPVPLLLLQLLCLWFDNGQLGESRCEIYSNMLEFLFKHAMKRRSYPETRSKTKKTRITRTSTTSSSSSSSSSSASSLPKCFSNSQLCCSQKALLLALGKLAFDGLFGVCPESSLLFTGSVIDEYLNIKMLMLCKETGILSQTNVCRKLTKTESNYSFIHKTYQEYLAALYISLRWSQKLQQQIFTFCSTRENILQVSNIFVFVSGMNQDVAHSLSKTCSKIVSNDEDTAVYRRNIGTLFLRSRLRMRRLHTLMIECLQESYDNGFERTIPIAQDVFINDKCKLDWLLEKRLIDKNMNNIRSLDIQADAVEEQVHEMLHSLHVHSLNRLEKLYIWGSIPTHDIAIVIQSSSQSLACLELWHLTFTDDLLHTVSNLNHLECLSLLSVSLSQSS